MYLLLALVYKEQCFPVDTTFVSGRQGRDKPPLLRRRDLTDIGMHKFFKQELVSKASTAQSIPAAEVLPRC